LDLIFTIFVDNNPHYFNNSVDFLQKLPKGRKIIIFQSEETPPNTPKEIEIVSSVDFIREVAARLDIPHNKITNACQLAVNKQKNHYTGLPFLKLFAPFYFSSPFWLLDADLDFKPVVDPYSFFNIQEAEASVLAAPENDAAGTVTAAGLGTILFHYEHYMNAGVIYYNKPLNYSNRAGAYARFIKKLLIPSFYLKLNAEIPLNEQGLFNYFHYTQEQINSKEADKYNPKFLPTVYNQPAYHIENKKIKKWMEIKEGIVHYKGQIKPWMLEEVVR
jgi:lipopolysaccharide biosynthesis glycosyltransferase